MFRLFFLSLIFLSIGACSPVKGYLGPERPKEELSLVYYDSCDSGINLVKASSEGVEFKGSGIELLPGKRVLDVSVERPMQPYNCIPETTFDDYGYRNCIDRRNQALAKNNNKYVPDCYATDFTTTVYWCDQEFQSFLCTNAHELVKGWGYNVCVYQQGMAVFFKVSYKDNTGPIIPVVGCQALGSDTRRVEFSYMP